MEYAIITVSHNVCGNIVANHNTSWFANKDAAIAASLDMDTTHQSVSIMSEKEYDNWIDSLS